MTDRTNLLLLASALVLWIAAYGQSPMIATAMFLSLAAVGAVIGGLAGAIQLFINHYR
jgi:uncharacterized membrane-anchored protein